MNVRKTDAFITDLEQQYGWYVLHAGCEVADRYLDAVEAVCRLISQQPNLGPLARFHHPKLQTWRFFPVLRPFGRHVLFYEISGGEIVLRRAMHGQRDLPRRLLESSFRD